MWAVYVTINRFAFKQPILANRVSVGPNLFCPVSQHATKCTSDSRGQPVLANRCYQRTAQKSLLGGGGLANVGRSSNIWPNLLNVGQTWTLSQLRFWQNLPSTLWPPSTPHCSVIIFEKSHISNCVVIAHVYVLLVKETKLPIWLGPCLIVIELFFGRIKEFMKIYSFLKIYIKRIKLQNILKGLWNNDSYVNQKAIVFNLSMLINNARMCQMSCAPEDNSPTLWHLPPG